MQDDPFSHSDPHGAPTGGATRPSRRRIPTALAAVVGVILGNAGCGTEDAKPPLPATGKWTSVASPTYTDQQFDIFAAGKAGDFDVPMARATPTWHFDANTSLPPGIVTESGSPSVAVDATRT